MDRSFIADLVREHRAVEARLDGLGEAIACGTIESETVRALAESLARHYASEERFLDLLAARDARLAAKLRAQHAEAVEIGERLLESVASTQDADARYLARRLLAIAQHNIIEEERDVFPLAERIFAAGP